MVVVVMIWLEIFNTTSARVKSYGLNDFHLCYSCIEQLAHVRQHALIVLLLIRAPFYVLLNFGWYVLCLLVVLLKLSLLANWLARKTPLRKCNRGEGIISIKPRLKRVYDCVDLMYSFVVLLHDVCVLPQPCVIYFLLLWHDIAYLCWTN